MVIWVVWWEFVGVFLENMSSKSLHQSGKVASWDLVSCAI